MEVTQREPWQLSVLVPSRGRPGSIQRLWDAIGQTAERPEWIRLMVRLDDDDPMADNYPLRTMDRIWYSKGPRVRLAGSWNELARVAREHGATHLALWGDDNIPLTQGWDRVLIERLRRDGPGWAYGCDGIWDNHRWREHPEHLILPTATVMSVELYEALGWVSPPGLTHLCIDVAWRDLGVEAGCLFFEPSVMIRHLHRMMGAPDDQTYRDANDDPEQFRSDNVASEAWRLSADFQRDVETVRRLRAVLRARRTS